jgi:aspartate kinase
MGIIVKKFGGTSVGSIERIKAIAEHLSNERKRYERIVVVVSAMAKTTDNLIQLAREISSKPCSRELDMLLTAGERISMSLLSLALQELGIQSISFTGSQSGIITDSTHGNAKIETVNAFRIKEELEKGKIVIVAGFQGVSKEKEITTLGRGGSDTSAVALSSYLEAEKCEIYTDVDGVYSADPRYVDNTIKYERLSYEQMLYLAYGGSKVLHQRSVEFALKYRIPIEVKSSFSFTEGTMIENMENSLVKAIAHKENIMILSIKCENSKIAEMINKINTEVFDYIINQNELQLLIESKYLESISSELSDTEVVFNSKKYAMISLSGIRVAYDKDFISEIINEFNRMKTNVYNMSTCGLGIRFLTDQENIKEVLQFIHNKYIR